MKRLCSLLLLCSLVALVAARAAAPPPTHRPLCEPGVTPPPNRFNSTERLRMLRNRMAQETAPGIDWYLVTGLNRMLSAPQPSEQYRSWLSGFTGSSGQILVSQTEAYLFTDTRYTVQADQELDCDWKFFDSLSTDRWVNAYNGTSVSLAVDAREIRARDYENLLNNASVKLVPLQKNLVDEIWVENRPEPIKQDIYPLAMTYTGKTWQAKVAQMRSEALGIGSDKADFLVVTGLDETAYLLNLRATVVANFPYFPSLVLLSADKALVFVDERAYFYGNESLRKHLSLNSDGTCEAGAQLCIELKRMTELSPVANQLLTNTSRVWLDAASCSYAVQSALSKAAIISKSTPVQKAKAVKNSAEQVAFKDCSLMDSAALVAFLNQMRHRMANNVAMTELSASALLANYRAKIPEFRGLSFTTIAASGPNAAVIHYRPTESTDRSITKSEAFLLDSGGHYLGCTTDVTRTLYYGDQPVDEVRDAYTRVLMGVIDLFNLTWPSHLTTRHVDPFARHNLWSVLKDYAHGTGHGIGLFLGVHEGPNGIGRDYPLEEGNFQSIEPGFYQREAAGVLGFGIRLETICGVKLTGKFLRFEPVTWVPFERKLIKQEMLSPDQLRWLNWYHGECRKRLPEALQKIGEQAAVEEWLNAATEPIVVEVKSAQGVYANVVTTFMPVLVAVFLVSKSV
uniref:AMP_N domain-containing protein n=1 Tax=Macrostomum lignano TaxID=282301 RepID=A0A1I8GG13_9PLAT